MHKQPTVELTMIDVRRALTFPLPGFPAQLQMAPEYREEELRDRTPPPEPKEAGVLILLYPQDDQLFFPLTRRTDTLESHKGQISLPGGAREAGESLEATALRETCEELCVCTESLEIVGSLSPLYVPPSGFLISPFIAFSPIRPSFVPDPAEVDELIETPLRLLFDPGAIVCEEWNLHGLTVTVPFFHISGHKVWGATAMVLSELVILMREASL